jgi:tetratricopeptide (TPR) repeat protein
VQVGGYAILEEIGRGGMGVVLRARSPEGREVALKVLMRLTGDRLARFERERRLLSELGESDGFVPLLDAGESPRGPYIVMPFLPGGTLRDRLKRGAMGVEETIALGRAIAGAAGRAHARGIVHRDLKPENIIMTSDGRPLVADLGLAKHFAPDAPGAAASVGLTRSNELRGTPGYMSLEQMEDVREAGPPADVFALGAILYECLAGAPAFVAPTLIALIDSVRRGEYASLSPLRPDAPAWLVAAIERALARDPEQRFASGAELEAALQPPSPRLARRAPAFVAAAAGIAAVSAVAFAGATRHESPPAADTARIADTAAPVTRSAPLDAEAGARALVRQSEAEAGEFQYYKAIETAKRAAELAPALAATWLAKGAVELERRDFESARPDLDRAIELDGGNAQAWFLRGCVRRGVRDLDGAAADLSKALELDPKHVRALAERALVWIGKEDGAAARRDAERALVLDPGSPDAFEAHCVVVFRTGDLNAVAGLGAFPTEPRILRGLAAHHGILELVPSGMVDATCDRRTQIDPADAAALALHAILSGPGPKRYAERSVELQPRLAFAWFALSKGRSPQDALEALKKAVELDPGFAAAWEACGKQRLELGDRAGAIESADRAIELDASDEQPWLTRSRAHEQLGDFEAAIADSERVLSLLARPGRNGNTALVLREGRARIELMRAGEAVFLEDALPFVAEARAESDPWEWVASDPVPFSGALCFRSRSGPGTHTQAFDKARTPLAVRPGDRLFAHVRLDAESPPREISIEWSDTDRSWEHRAFWGEDEAVSSGRVRVGPLPAPGQWVRLEVPASSLGLEGKAIRGMSFTALDGRAAWDHVGRTDR